ncbi:glycosyl hydrolase [Chryseobacterium sp. KACC 21268]|nr:glycosyl hydrolase [Chryseobacterium sp. KACC 21268]
MKKFKNIKIVLRQNISLLLLLIGSLNLQAQIISGVNGHPLYSEDYRPFSFEQQMQLLKKNNFSYYRFEATFNPDGTIRYTNGTLTDLIAVAKKYNVKLLPSILIPSSEVLDSVSNVYEKGFTEGRKVATQNAKYFPVIEVGNEYNLRIVKDGKIPEDGVFVYDTRKEVILMGYMKGFINGIKSVDKSVKILVGVALDDYHFFEEMKKFNIDIDIIGNNRYKPGDAAIFKKMYDVYKKPIWITEFNYPEGSTHADVSKQSKWVNENIKKLKSIKYIEAIFIYQLLDENRNLNKANILPAEANYGLYKVQGTKLTRKLSLKP